MEKSEIDIKEYLKSQVVSRLDEYREPISILMFTEVNNLVAVADFNCDAERLAMYRKIMKIYLEQHEEERK